MNTVEALEFLKAALKAAGYKPAQIVTGMDFSKPGNNDSVPGASVYCLETRLLRQNRKATIQASDLNPPVEGAVGGVRHMLAGGLTWYEVTLTQRGMAEMQNTLAQFLEYVLTTPLVDRSGTSYKVLSEGVDREKELRIVWNDQDQQDRVTATLEIPLPGALWTDHPLIPIEIIVQYRLEGGNPDE